MDVMCKMPDTVKTGGQAEQTSQMRTAAASPARQRKREVRNEAIPAVSSFSCLSGSPLADHQPNHGSIPPVRVQGQETYHGCSGSI